MSAKIIDGRVLATSIRDRVKAEVTALVAQRKPRPHLAVILIGENPASQIYVSHKEKVCLSVGIESETIRLSNDVTQKEVMREIDRLNRDENVHGILVQLPLPKQLDKDAIIAAIEPNKDVDGLTPLNQGRLVWRQPGLYPCTPLGILELIRSTEVKLSGKVAAIVGRSLLVGMPAGLLLELAGCTTICLHSESVDTKRWTREAEVLVVATGVRHLVKKDWVRPGAIVIDVGMHRDGAKLTGDVDYETVKDIAGYITPVPGGVGPMTVAMLASNCLAAYKLLEIK